MLYPLGVYGVLLDFPLVLSLLPCEQGGNVGFSLLAEAGIEINKSSQQIQKKREALFNHIWNTERKVDNTTRSRVFSDKRWFVMRHYLECMVNFANKMILKEKRSKGEEFSSDIQICH